MADQIGNLAYKLTVDNSNFSGGLAKSSSDLKAFSGSARAESSKFEGAFNRIGEASKDIFTGFQTGGISGAVGSLTGQVSSLGSQFVQFAGIGGTFATGFIAGFAGIVAACDATTKSLNDINKTARGIGESGQNVQVLSRVLQGVGFDAEQSQQVLLKFFDKLGDIRANPGGPGADAIKKIGLDPQALVALNPAAAFEATVTALNGVTNVYDRASLSQQIFGKAFTELEPLIRRGGRAFQEARADVAAFGADASVLAAAQEASLINRNLARENERSVWGPLRAGWDATAAGISSAVARGRKSISDFLNDGVNAIRRLRGVSEIDFNARPAAGGGPVVPAFDAAAAAAAARTQAANTSAQALAKEWRASADNVGLTARQIAIVKAQQEGASVAVLNELRARDSILTSMERRNALAKEMQGLLAANATAAEKFSEAVNKIAEAGLRGNQSARLLGATFRQLESAIGLGGRQDFSMTGLAAGSIDAARQQADLQTRRNNGVDNIQGRILAALELANQIAADQLVENTAIAAALANTPGLGLAPLRLE